MPTVIHFISNIYKQSFPLQLEILHHSLFSFNLYCHSTHNTEFYPNLIYFMFEIHLIGIKYKPWPPKQSWTCFSI